MESKKDLGLMYAGLGTSVFGMAASSLYPLLTSSQGNLIALSGVGLVALHFLQETEQKQKEKDIAFWNNFKLVKDNKCPVIHQTIKRDFGYTWRLTAPYGITTKDFKAQELALCETLNAKRIEVSYKNRFVFLDIYEIALEDMYFYSPEGTKGLLQFIIGRTFGNKLVIMDLKNLAMALIGGETGMGKTNLLRILITNHILTKNPNLIKFTILDLKGTGLDMFEDCKIVELFEDRIEAAPEVIYDLYLEMNKRYRKFKEIETNNIDKYNKVSKSKIYYKIIIIDEFQELMDDDKTKKMLQRICSKGREAGFHVILSTQRPTVDYVPGSLKINLGNRIALHMVDEVNSRVILDEAGAEKLEQNGHGIYKGIEGKKEFRAMFMDEDDIKELIEPYKVKKKKREIKENLTGITTKDVDPFD